MKAKDYNLIASAVRQMHSLKDNHLYVADMLAVTLERNNPKFNRDKFLQACGIDTGDAFDNNGNRDNRGI